MKKTGFARVLTGQIPPSVGFSQTSGQVRKLTRKEKQAQKLALADMAKAANGRIIVCDMRKNPLNH